MRQAPLMGFRISTAAVLLLIVGTQAAAQDRGGDVPPEGKPLLTEPAAMAKGFTFAEKYIKAETGETKAGWYPVFKTSVTGDGWISLGSGYRLPMLERRAWVDASAAYSWRGYKVA